MTPGRTRRSTPEDAGRAAMRPPAGGCSTRRSSAWATSATPAPPPPRSPAARACRAGRSSTTFRPRRSWSRPPSSISSSAGTRSSARRSHSVPAGADRYAAAIDILWSMVSGPTFYAWLELAVAARTDAELRRAVQGLDGASCATGRPRRSASSSGAGAGRQSLLRRRAALRLRAARRPGARSASAEAGRPTRRR